MKYLTLEEVKQAAQEGELASAKQSLGKWQSMMNATCEELKKMPPFYDGSGYCALCAFSVLDNYTGYIKCDRCILSSVGSYTKIFACILEYHQAINVIADYISGTIDRISYIEAVKPLVEKLEKAVELLEERDKLS